MRESTGKVIVVGGSIAGLFIGVLLSRAGWRVDIYERASDALASRGAGITTHDELYAAFRQAGVRIEHEVAVECSERILLDCRGAVLGRLAMPQLMTSWGLLYRFLRSCFDDLHYHKAMSLQFIEQDEREVIAQFANGERVSADYLVGADGLRSTVRGLVMPEATVRYAGYTAWRGLAAEADLPPAARESLSGRFTLCLPPHEHMLGYMVAGPDDTVAVGQRCYNWVWYRPAPAATRLRELMTGTDGAFYPHGIPHHLIQPRFFDELRNDASRLIAPPLRAALEATARPFLQPIHELASRRLVNGRVIVIGDAAFSARPHIGLGVSKAADDAAQLARAFQCCRQEFPAALEQWQLARLAFGNAAVRHSAQLGCTLDGKVADDEATRREHAFFRSPAVVLARIAARNPYQFLE